MSRYNRRHMRKARSKTERAYLVLIKLYFCARYRKVTTSARVQVAFGVKV